MIGEQLSQKLMRDLFFDNFVKRAIKPLGKILRIQKKQITKIRGWDKTFYEHHIGLHPLISDTLPLGLLGEIKPL